MTETPLDEHDSIQINPAQVIYADQIVGFGIGAIVSRLTLANEIGPNQSVAFAQLVLPTTVLLEAARSILDYSNNQELQQRLTQDIDKLKSQIIVN